MAVKVAPKIETKKIAELQPHPMNPRVHPESLIDKLTKSIETFGWTNPVICDAEYQILAGHARVKAAEKLGLKEVPVIVVPLSGDEATAYLIADNRLAEESGWDRSLLKDLISELDHGAFELSLTGFDAKQLEELMTAAAPPGGFKSFGEDIETAYQCPKCGYEWSGKAKEAG